MTEAINLTAIFISFLSFIMALASIILVVAQKMSTHKIEWRPLAHNPIEEEVEESELSEDLDRETLSKALNLQKNGKKKKEDKDPLDSILESNNF